MNIRDGLELIGDHLQVFLFGLMGLGLALASAFLWLNMITGDNWVAVCGILFGSNTIGTGLTHIGRGRARAADSGNQKPV